MIPPDFDPDGPAPPGSGLFGLPATQPDAQVVVIPVPFEATTSYRRGTARAPERILEASHQVELHDLWVGEPWRHGIVMRSVDPGLVALNDEACALALPIVEAGGASAGDPALDRVNAIGAEVNRRVHAAVAEVLHEGRVPAVVGGDHSVSFGAIQAASEAVAELGILHIDAHADLRHAYEGFEWSHASVLHNVHERTSVHHIVQVGLRDIGRAEAQLIERSPRITAVTGPEIAWETGSGEPWSRICGRIVRALPPRVWVTFDVDGLDPSLCPNTGTPVPGGLSFDQVLLLLQHLAEERDIVGFDLVEVGDGEWDAMVGARLLYKLAGWCVADR